MKLFVKRQLDCITDRNSATDEGNTARRVVMLPACFRRPDVTVRPIASKISMSVCCCQGGRSGQSATYAGLGVGDVLVDLSDLAGRYETAFLLGGEAIRSPLHRSSKIAL
jgi:hypothetical protein